MESVVTKVQWESLVYRAQKVQKEGLAQRAKKGKSVFWVQQEPVVPLDLQEAPENRVQEVPQASLVSMVNWVLKDGWELLVALDQEDFQAPMVN